MSGYHNYSMSNNAILAYQSGEKPLSKWTKASILKELKEQGASEEHMSLFQKMKLPDLKKTVLYKSSWHHTSSHYNSTDFYSVEYDEYKDYKLPEAIEHVPPDEKLVYAHFLEWSGTRNHPKCTEHSRWGVIKGNTFYYISCNDIKSKRITANGFNTIEESNIPFSKEKLSKFLDRDYLRSLAEKKKLSVDEITGISLYYADNLYKGNEIISELIKLGFSNSHVALLSKSTNKYIDNEFTKIDEKSLTLSCLKDIRLNISNHQVKKSQISIEK